MTPDPLRAIITRYQKRRNFPSFTRAAESVAVDIGMKPGSIWALISGVNRIREMWKWRCASWIPRSSWHHCATQAKRLTRKLRYANLTAPSTNGSVMSTNTKVVEMKKSERMMEMTITPDIARSWLEVNIHNRPVNDNTIKRYVEAMKSQQWELDGQTIKFSDQGVLLDGQHKLRAVVQSGLDIRSYVVFGLPQKVFDTIDTGHNRTIGDLLALGGEVNGVVMGPALRLLYVKGEFGSVSAMDEK